MRRGYTLWMHPEFLDEIGSCLKRVDCLPSRRYQSRGQLQKIPRQYQWMPIWLGNPELQRGWWGHRSCSKIDQIKLHIKGRQYRTVLIVLEWSQKYRHQGHKLDKKRSLQWAWVRLPLERPFHRDRGFLQSPEARLDQPWWGRLETIDRCQNIWAINLPFDLL